MFFARSASLRLTSRPSSALTVSDVSGIGCTWYDDSDSSSSGLAAYPTLVRLRGVNSSALTMRSAPARRSPRLAFNAAGFMATSTSGRSPGVCTSWSAKCSWNAETPGRVPAGARISAGKSGSVDRSLPNSAVSLVKRSPVSCMPSPESPANRMMTRSRCCTCFDTVRPPGIDRRLDPGRSTGSFVTFGPLTTMTATASVRSAGPRGAGGATVHGYFGGYGLVALLGLLGVGFLAVGFAANRLLRPWRTTPEKLTTYESGVDPVGAGWEQTQVRYYVYAFLYVVFAVDAVFLFPWATVFALPGFWALSLGEMFVFLGFLAVGLLYAWRKGVLTWV